MTTGRPVRAAGEDVRQGTDTAPPPPQPSARLVSSRALVDVETGAGTVLVAAADPFRRKVIVFNDSTGDTVYLGSDPSRVSGWFPLVAGAALELDVTAAVLGVIAVGGVATTVYVAETIAGSD